MIKVESTINVIPEDQTNVKEIIIIASHQNKSEFVDIVIQGRSWTVNADDLKCAIDNATNSNRC